MVEIISDIWVLFVILGGAGVLTAMIAELTSGGTFERDRNDFKKKENPPTLCRFGIHKIVNHPNDGSGEWGYQICLRCGLLRSEWSDGEWTTRTNIRYEEDPKKIAQEWRNKK